MDEKLDELQQTPRDPTTPESIKIKEEFWKKMSENLKHMKEMVEGWIEEDKKNEIK